jgi:hypothetical protein
MGIWMALVIAAMSAANDPAQFLWGTTAQVVYAIAVVLLLLVLSRWVLNGRGFIAQIAFQGQDGGMHAS